jgi:hypothetical protein
MPWLPLYLDIGPEIWAMPSALAQIEAGVPRDANPG